MLGGYAFTAYKSGAAPQGPGEVVVLTDTARTKAAQHGPRGRRGRQPRPPRWPATG